MPLVTPGEGPVTPALVEEATAGLTATARRIGALGGPIDLALSGGKDSRLLAAAFFEAGVEARLYTRAVYDDEAAIAVELVRRLGPGRVRHDIVGHGDTAGGFSFSDVPVDPLASARYLVSFSGGLRPGPCRPARRAGGLGTPGVSGRRPCTAASARSRTTSTTRRAPRRRRSATTGCWNASSSAAWSGRAR